MMVCGSAMARPAADRPWPHPNPMTAHLPQGCVVPYRLEDDRLRICLISLRSQSGWGFPKGLVDPPESLPEAALREAFEEAGIHGHLVGDPLGTYSYVKRGVNLDVTVFLMRITVVAKSWPEQRVRERRFCTVEKARSLLAIPGQLQLLERALVRLAHRPHRGV